MNLRKSGLVMVGNAAFLADLLCSKVGFFPGINLGALFINCSSLECCNRKMDFNFYVSKSF